MRRRATGKAEWIEELLAKRLLAASGWSLLVCWNGGGTWFQENLGVGVEWGARLMRASSASVRVKKMEERKKVM